MRGPRETPHDERIAKPGILCSIPEPKRIGLVEDIEGLGAIVHPKSMRGRIRQSHRKVVHGVVGDFLEAGIR